MDRNHPSVPPLSIRNNHVESGTTGRPCPFYQSGYLLAKTSLGAEYRAHYTERGDIATIVTDGPSGPPASIRRSNIERETEHTTAISDLR